MPLDNLLGELVDAAFQSLSDKFKKDGSNHDSVKLIIDDAKGDTFTFLLHHGGDNYHWERKNWYKQNDISTMFKPFNSLQKIFPTTIEQQGVTELEEAKEIFSLAKSLLKLNINEETDSTAIEETGYCLQIKLDGISKSFKWKIIPHGWDSVEVISNKIIQLNNLMY